MKHINLQNCGNRFTELLSRRDVVLAGEHVIMSLFSCIMIFFKSNALEMYHSRFSR